MQQVLPSINVWNAPQKYEEYFQERNTFLWSEGRYLYLKTIQQCLCLCLIFLIYLLRSDTG